MPSSGVNVFPSALVGGMKYAASLILVAMLLSSCTVPLTCVLYNNTSDPFIVTKVDLKGGEETFDLLPGSSIELSGWPLNNYIVSYGNLSWRYDPPVPRAEYVEMSGFGPFVKRRVYAQLEQDGRIFLLLKGQKPPVLPLPEQPEGYPLEPKK